MHAVRRVCISYRYVRGTTGGREFYKATTFYISGSIDDI